MRTREDEAERDFKHKVEVFHQNLTAKVAEQLAKAEAERERQKQMALAVAMSIFTGGAGLPTLAAAGASQAVGKLAKSTKTASGTTGASPNAVSASAAKNPTPTEPKTANSGKPTPGVKVYDTPIGPLPHEEGVYADWLDPLAGLLMEGFQAARGAGIAIGNRLGWLKNIPEGATGVPTAPAHIYSARELIRSAEEAGAYHSFPAQFDKYVFEGTKRVISEDYVLYSRPGTLNGRTGTFEMGVRPSSSGSAEVIKHRFFRPADPKPP